jgi:hypothetical protein
MSRQLPTWTSAPNEALIASHDTVSIDIGFGFSYPELIQGLRPIGVSNPNYTRVYGRSTAKFLDLEIRFPKNPRGPLIFS